MWRNLIINVFRAQILGRCGGWMSDGQRSARKFVELN